MNAHQIVTEFHRDLEASTKASAEKFEHDITEAVAEAIECPAWVTSCDSKVCYCLNAARAVLRVATTRAQERATA